MEVQTILRFMVMPEKIREKVRKVKKELKLVSQGTSS